MNSLEIIVSIILISNVVLCEFPNLNSTHLLPHKKRQSRMKITIEFPLNRKVCGFYNAKYRHGHCEKQGREIRIKKVCPKDRRVKCPYRYKPVCGDDGVTYRNEYYVKDGVQITSKGRCFQNNRPTYNDRYHCPYNYAPICGADGVTYKNPNCVPSGVRIIFKDTCPPEFELYEERSTIKEPLVPPEYEIEDCPHTYAPVCGNDGVTYKNRRCVKRGVRIVSIGICSSDVEFSTEDRTTKKPLESKLDICPHIYSPVCGADGVTYMNSYCVKKGVSIVFNGSCSSKLKIPTTSSTTKPPREQPELELTDCPYTYKPICGADGVTYRHYLCIKKGVRIISRGPCASELKINNKHGSTKLLKLPVPELDDCPYKYAPVCGADGVTYKHYYCVKKGVPVVKNGPCSSEFKIPTTHYTTRKSTTKQPRQLQEFKFKDCPYTYAPVCGADGITYRHYLCIKKEVRIVSRGPCPLDFQPSYKRRTTKQPPKQPQPELDDCPYEYEPVCGADGKTYKNYYCVKKGVPIVKNGPCLEFNINDHYGTTELPSTLSEIELDNCPYNYEPVCGADGITYKHYLCVKKQVLIVSEGPCSVELENSDKQSISELPTKQPEIALDDCPYHPGPVCGSDGVTYKHYLCVKEDVVIVSNGSCASVWERADDISTTEEPSIPPEMEHNNCPYKYEPVCGSDGVTYWHQLCVKKGVRIVSEGACSPKLDTLDEVTTIQPNELPEIELDDCPYEYAPVCGTDGVTYKHYMCVKADVHIAFNGPCSPEPSKLPTTDSDIYCPNPNAPCDPPACHKIDSNGRCIRDEYYVSQPQLNLHLGTTKAYKDTSPQTHAVSLLGAANNVKPELDLSPCPYGISQVCGDDGVTYKNPRCVKLGVRVISKGPCK